MKALNTDLATAATERGEDLTWTERDLDTIAAIANLADIRADLLKRYRQSEDLAAATKTATEVRQLSTTIGRLTDRLKIDAVPQKSITSVKASRAANIRWERARAQGAL